MAKGRYPTISHIMEVTEFKTKERAQAALDTLKWLEEGGDTKLDALDGKFRLHMGKYIEGGTSSCGTYCCIAGAILACEHGKGNTPGFISPFSPLNGINAYFNIQGNRYDESELSKLFWSYPIPETCNTELAAKVLKRYLEEGITDWKVDV